MKGKWLWVTRMDGSGMLFIWPGKPLAKEDKPLFGVDASAWSTVFGEEPPQECSQLMLFSFLTGPQELKRLHQETTMLCDELEEVQ